MDERDSFFQKYHEIVESRSLELDAHSREPIGSYFYWLERENQKYNLTGYEVIEDFVDFHLADTLEILKAIHPAENSILTDVGTGAGVPGLLIKILRPDLHVNLVETSQKKARFLQLVCKELNLCQCEVICLRAEEAAHQEEWREKSHWAIARALGSVSTALELTSGFVQSGGMVVLPRGQVENAWEEAQRCAEPLGCQLKRVEPYSIPRREKPFQLLFFQKKEILDGKYPRKPGQIQKRPL